LRSAAGEQRRISRMVRVGTVKPVEVVAAQRTEIHRALSEGGFDLGQVNHLDGDDVPSASRPPNCCAGGRWCACVPTARSPPSLP
jgi:hypothetical protein